MADEQSTAPVTDETEDDGVELEDTDVSFDDFEDTDEQAEAEAETEAEEDESDTETDEETEEDEAEEASEEESTEEETPELSEEEKQKAFNKQMAERRIQEKQERAQSIKAQQEQYLNEAEDPRDLALRQLQIDAYDNRIEKNTNSLTNSYERAINDFPILRDTSPEIKSFVDTAIDEFEKMYVQLDQYGNPADVRDDFYQYLQNKAETISKLSGIGAKAQEKAKGKEKSKTLATPSRTPKQAKRDADLDAFDEEAARP